MRSFWVAGRQAPAPPRGYELAVLETDELRPQWESGQFHNGLGRLDEENRFTRVIRAHVLREQGGRVVAVAALWLRRLGSGRSASMCFVACVPPGLWQDRGTRGQPGHRSTPGMAAYYSCGAANIRSQRTALSCGYLPAPSWAGVAPKGRQQTERG